MVYVCKENGYVGGKIKPNIIGKCFEVFFFIYNFFIIIQCTYLEIAFLHGIAIIFFNVNNVTKYFMI